MTTWMKLGSGLAIACGFMGLFWAASGFGSMPWGAPATTSTPEPVKRGNYGRYLYSITGSTAENKKVAQFEPTLPDDDAVVIEVLKVLAQDGVGQTVPADTPPMVETVNEANCITFSVADTKIVFELFRNSSGRVGTVRFWTQRP